MERRGWVENVLRPLGIGVMMGCLALSLADLVHLYGPGWSRLYLILCSIIAVLEASYSHWLIRHTLLRSDDRLKLRLYELAALFVLVKAGSYVGDRWVDMLADIRTWPYHPLRIFDAKSMVAYTLTFASWFVATRTMQDLERIGEPPPIRETGYTPPRVRLINLFFWGGGILLVTSGFARVGIANLLDLERPSVPQLVLNVLVYFLVGLVMIGQVQVTRLHRQWQAQRVKVADHLVSRWARYSLAFISLAALLAFLLPTGYTVGLLDIAATVIYVVAYLLTLITAIAWFIFSLLLLPFAWLFGRTPPSPPGGLTLRPPPLVPQTGPGAKGPGWLEILRSLLFWTVTLSMVYYVIRSYLRDHPELLEALYSLKPVRLLLAFLTTFWRRLTGWAQTAADHFPAPFARWRAGKDGAAEGPFRFFRLGAITPRERILYYYLSVLKRASQQGLPRRHSHTPSEYGETLGPHLPEAQQDVAQLTETFVEARYSCHTFDHAQDKRARTHWKQIRTALRTLKRTSDTEHIGRDQN